MERVVHKYHLVVFINDEDEEISDVEGATYLTIQDMEVIIADLFKCDDPYTCPHGRPTMVKYSKYELEKFFKR